MTVINANLVKDLREKTGAGMMDCKKVLVEAQGNLEVAIDLLRKRGLSQAAKKAGRIAAEGLVVAYTSANKGSVLELNSETDFVSKNDKFQTLASNLAKDFFNSDGNFDGFANSNYSASNKPISEVITDHIAVIGENLSLRRATTLTVDNGTVVSYIHNQVAPGLGKIAVLVALESSAAEDKLQALGKQLAMHIAATKPESLSVADLDQALVQKERDILTDQAKSSGKPDAVIAKMVDGRIAKFYEQVVFLEQLFVMDGKTKISQVVEDAAKAAGAPITVRAFVRFGLGEGIEKVETDFAAEVAAAAQGA
ncbi:MAG: translation elongation factor Ts [Rickettsiales bacterium]